MASGYNFFGGFRDSGLRFLTDQVRLSPNPWPNHANPEPR